MQAQRGRSRTRLVLVNLPYFRRLYRGPFRRLFSHYLPSLTLASLGAAALGVLEANGGEVEAIDAPRAGSDDADSLILERVVRGRPGIVGFTCTTPMFPAAADMARKLKEKLPESLLVCGGYHPSALPEVCLAESRFDAAVVGEGEETLSDLARFSLAGGRSGTNGAGLEAIDGVVFRDGAGRTRATRPRALEPDLDRLPMPAFSLLDFAGRRYNTLYHRRAPVAVLEASRGCPFRCSFCSKPVYGQTHRAKSPARLIEEIRVVRGLGFREVYFVDDSFLTDRARAARFCEDLSAARLDMPWSCHARIDEADPELLTGMRRAGCHSIAYGIESPDPALGDVRSKTVSVPFLTDRIARTREAGIRAMGMFVLGLPEENEESLRETLRLSTALGLDSAKWTVAVPFPGTPIHEDLDRAGAIRSRQWDLYRLHGDPDLIFRHPKIPVGAIRRAYESAYLRFYLRPGFVVRSAAAWMHQRLRSRL